MKIPDEYAALLKAISQSYNHYEADRKLIERSMDLSSQELLEVNSRLHAESERQKIVLGTLKESLGALQLDAEDGEIDAEYEDELIYVAELLRQQIEKRREVEAKLQESEERFRLLAENSTDVIARYSTDAICLYVSPSCRPLLGYEPTDLVGQSIFEFIHPDDLDDLTSGFETLLNRPEMLTVRGRLLCKDGSYIWFEATAHAVRDVATGTPTQVHATIRDITERKKAEDELAKLSLVASRTDNAVVITDASGLVEWVNDGFTRISGYTLDEVIGRNPGSLLQGPLTDQRTVSRIRKAIRNKSTFTEEILNYHKSGRPYWLSMNVTPILDEDGDVVRFVSVQTDITERKEIEASIQKLNQELHEANMLLREERDIEKEHVKVLEQLNQMKSEFVSSVSHELRTPLASIIGFAQTILVDPDLPTEVQHEFLQIILDEGKRLAKLINDLLDLARIESGRAIMEKSETDLVPLIQRAVYAIAMQADAKKQTVRIEIEEPSIIANFDGDRVAQVIVNLLSNAVKFTPEGGSVSVSAGFSGPNVEIRVSDTGLGIPKDDLDKLFDKFYRVHRPGLDIRGTGLGLAIARQLVELHGGKISVESEVDKGSTFTILLPRQ
jgi:PAS domain S-box-containing protein